MDTPNKKQEVDEFLEALDDFERIKAEEQIQKMNEEFGVLEDPEPESDSYVDWWLNHISRIHKK